MVATERVWRGAASADCDPRLDPRLKVYLKSFTDQTVPDIPQPNEPQLATREEVLALRARQLLEVPARFKASMKYLQKNLPPPTAEDAAQLSAEGLESSTHSFISQPDSNTVKLLLVRPTASSVGETVQPEQALPLVYYIHGGGMRNQSAFDPQYINWARVLARQGVVVGLVDFRNSEIPSASNSEIAAYPGGLNDCYSGLSWCHAHASDLKVDPGRIIVAGESGGGNLSIATALKLKRDGRLSLVSGFYVLCPYLAGTWPQDVTHEGILGDSHLADKNNGYIIALGGARDMSNAAMGYSAEAFRAGDALSWPGFASEDELRGLPRCVVTVDECDPLRDEGIHFYRRLLAAGVKARCWQMMGCSHAAAVVFTFIVPDIGIAAARSIADFAHAHIRSPLANL